MAKEFMSAESVAAMAASLLPAHHAELATARIKYIFVDKGPVKNGRPLYGKVRKISGEMEFLLELDFLVVVGLDQWNELDEVGRRSVVDHLLERCTGEEDEKNGGEMVWSLREPDVQEFASVLRRNGAWHQHLQDFVTVAQSLELDPVLDEVLAEARLTVGEGSNTSEEPDIDMVLRCGTPSTDRRSLKTSWVRPGRFSC